MNVNTSVDLTEPTVPTGIKTGVFIIELVVFSSPALASPSLVSSLKDKLI